MMRSRRAWVAWAALALAPGGPLRAEERPDPRPELETLEALLERAVDNVSRSGAAAMIGSSECRGYRIAGVGVVFVMTPRAMSGARSVFFLRDGKRGRVTRVRPERRSNDDAARQLALVEARADELTREAARAREEAERALEQVSRRIRIRWATPDSSAQPTEAPDAPVAPAAPLPPAAPRAPAALRPEAPPEAELDAPLAPPPPWSYWFETHADLEGEEDERAPEAIVADVKNALSAVLESHGPKLRALKPEEMLIAAVDFVDGEWLAARPHVERTLVVRVQKRDLDARQARQISSDELRKRIAYVEY